MRQFLSLFCALVLILAPLPPPVFAQTLNQTAAFLNTASTDCLTAGSCVVLALGSLDRTASVTANGTFSGTLQIEGSASGGSQWTAMSCPTWSAGAAVSSFTATGGWTCDIAGKTHVRIRQSSYTSGGATISLASSQGVASIAPIQVPQNLATTSTPTFTGINATTGDTFNGITRVVKVASDFTTSGVGTNSEAITGLTYSLPAGTVLAVPVHCGLTYLQNTGNAAVTFAVGFSGAPTNAQFEGIGETAVTAIGVLGATAITTATTGAILTLTPGATATNYYASFDGYIENPSLGSANTVTFYARTATAADTVTVRRGSYCSLQF